jgi:NAD(P)-dependent dehydrogenase (short-subunit alcohol dehydrogenase family)
MSERDARVAVVTGGAQGIGLGIVRRLVSDGWRVAALDVDREALLEVEAWAQSPLVMTLLADVKLEDEVALALGEVEERWGRLDALVNNAGIASPWAAPIEKLAYADWHRVLATNLDGVFLCCKHAASALRRSGGSIVNLASTRALQSEPNTEAYAASKGGVVALTHALAVSLGPAVRVNCVSPGWIDVSEWKKSTVRRSAELRPIDHQQHPAGRVGSPPDVAALVAFLLGQEAGFITGQNFVVDGGMVRRMIYAE